MKKYLIILSIAFLAVVSVANAQQYTFTQDLAVGSTGAEVTALQSWLISNGYDIPAISSGVAYKGYFGSQTRVALVRFQNNAGLPATGYFGPLTRGEILRRGGGGSNPSMKVFSPNGGESFAIGSRQNISWSDSSAPMSSGVSIVLVRNISGCFNAGTRPCLAVVDPEYTIATNIANTGTYQWSVGAYSQIAYNGYQTDATTIGDNYYIKICRGTDRNIGSCDASDSVFSIVSTNNQAPIINGIDAPTALNALQTGTWTIRATDPQNSTLSYSVDWGDAVLCPYGYTCSAPGIAPQANLQQSATFTHSFVNSGSYVVKFTVRNSAGLISQSSVTVQVGPNSATSPLYIISPNGGENWQKGTTQTIQWTSPAYFRATYADIKLIPYYAPCTGQVCPMNSSMVASYPYQAPYTIATNISINQNSYVWSVGTFIFPPCSSGYVCDPIPMSDGQYMIQICETGTNNCDSSNSYFTITSSPLPPTQTITSPNGGEVWQSNTTQRIAWSTTGLAYINSYLDIYLDQANIYCITTPCGSTYVLDRNILSSNIYNWIVATDINNVQIPAGDYRVRICSAGSTINCDSSDRAFTILR